MYVPNSLRRVGLFLPAHVWDYAQPRSRASVTESATGTAAAVAEKLNRTGGEPRSGPDRDRSGGLSHWVAYCGLLLLAACGRERLPELPELDTQRFLPALRDVVSQAHQTALDNPRDAAPCGRLGMVLHAHEQYAAAETCYRRAHLLDGSSFRWLYHMAGVQAAQGGNEQAIETLRRALKIDAGYLAARLRRAELLLELGRIDESEGSFRDLLATASGTASAHHGLGRILAARGDHRSAADSLRRACELFPAYGAAHYALALAYTKLGEAEKSKEHLALYEKHKTTAPAANDPLLAEVRALAISATSYIRDGVTMESQGKLEEAVAAHLKALELDPKVEQAHVNLISLYARLGRPENSAEHYRSAVALNPNLAEAHYNYGVLVFGQQKTAEARQAFTQALRGNPYHAEAHNNLGFLLEREGRQEEALAHYRQAVANQPDYRLAHFHIGRILASRRNYKDAIQHLEKTITPEDESTPGYLFALGAAWGRSGDHRRAIVYMRQAREQALRRGQNQLLASIERDLAILERAR